MIHLEEGAIVALRDGEGPLDRESAHLDGCGSCQDALHASRSRSASVAEALALLDDPVDVAAAKAAVRRQLDARRATGPARLGWARRHLGRAAVLLLVSAGAASALPWSPVRDWWRGSPEAEPVSTAAPEPTVGTVQSARASGISVAVPEGRIAVIVRGVAPGSIIDVVWVDEPAARVSAPAGSGFTYADGRAEVDAARGPIEVELPRAADLATLEVDGQAYLRRSFARLDILGPVVERAEDRVRFVVPGR